MKERIVNFISFCSIFGIIVALFFGMRFYEKSDAYMNDSYDVWFEGEGAQNLAAQSEQLAYSPDELVYVLKVGEEMALQDVIQHRFYGHNQGGSTIYYSIQYKNERNELMDYEFSHYEQVKIVCQHTPPKMKHFRWGLGFVHQVFLAR